jgi:hypothetical protein
VVSADLSIWRKTFLGRTFLCLKLNAISPEISPGCWLRLSADRGSLRDISSAHSGPRKIFTTRTQTSCW